MQRPQRAALPAREDLVSRGAAAVPACAPWSPRVHPELWKPGLSSLRAHRQWMATPCSRYQGKTFFALCSTQCPANSVFARVAQELALGAPGSERGSRGADRGLCTSNEVGRADRGALGRGGPCRLPGGARGWVRPARRLARVGDSWPASRAGSCGPPCPGKTDPDRARAAWRGFTPCREAFPRCG